MGLLQLLKSDKNARKIFGKSELKIIEKQMLGINLSQSEKNRLSRDIRVKFEFIDKVSLFKDNFQLMKGSETKKLIDEIKNIILKDQLRNQIKNIKVFGSFVNKKFTFKSDIDIAVEFKNIDLREATLFRKRILGQAPQKADIQVYNVLPEKIKKEIDKDGRIIYEQNK